MPKLLTTEQMAEFASSGCLFFDELIDEQTNKEFLDDIGHTEIDEVVSVQDYYRNIKATSSIPRIPAGTNLKDAYPKGSPLEKIFANYGNINLLYSGGSDSHSFYMYSKQHQLKFNKIVTIGWSLDSKHPNESLYYNNEMVIVEGIGHLDKENYYDLINCEYKDIKLE